MSAIAAPTGLVLLIGLVIGLGVYFAPSALAILKGNIFKGQVIKYQLIILVITIVILLVVSVFGIFSAARIEPNRMSQAAMEVTQDAQPEVATPAESSASGAKILSMICVIGGGIWSLVSIVLWFYILIHALKDQQMTLLSRFGINI